MKTFSFNAWQIMGKSIDAIPLTFKSTQSAKIFANNLKILTDELPDSYAGYVEHCGWYYSPTSDMSWAKPAKPKFTYDDCPF